MILEVSIKKSVIFERRCLCTVSPHLHVGKLDPQRIFVTSVDIVAIDSIWCSEKGPLSLNCILVWPLKSHPSGNLPGVQGEVLDIVVTLVMLVHPGATNLTRVLPGKALPSRTDGVCLCSTR